MSPATSPRSTEPAKPPTGLKAPPLGQLLNIPNLLTLCRIVSIPFLLALLSERRFRDALYLFAVAAATDGLDGAVARWFNSKTELGAFLDPFADKLLLVSSFVALTVLEVLPGWVLGVVAVRDIVIVFGYFMLVFFTGERIPVRPNLLGKVSTFLQLACVVGALLGFASGALAMQWNMLLYLTIAATGISGLQYMYRGLVWLNSREPGMFV